jgi:hypothetical protein
MKKTLNGSHFTRQRLTGVLAVAALAVLAVGIDAAVVGGFRSPAATPATAQGGGSPDGVKTELITVTPTGFDPAELTLPAGPVVLEVDNRSGLEEVTLRLSRSDGATEEEAQVDRATLDWSGELNLSPGAYVLGEAGHPDWACRITVTPQ